MTRRMKIGLFGVVFLFGAAMAEPLQRWPGNAQDKASLQRGAWLFVRHCLACHDAAGVDAQRLQSLGFTDRQIREEFSRVSGIQADRMRAAAEPEQLKQAFGVVPPDLSMLMRSRSSGKVSGADWVYTFLHAYYPDPKSPSGWNNDLRPGIVMPNVLQGLPDHQPPGKLQRPEDRPFRRNVQDGFDKRVSDLVAYLVWMSGSGQKSGSETPNSARWNQGKEGIEGMAEMAVLFFLGLLLFVVYALKREYWKDVR